jgi:hypothetical protein
MYPEVPCPSRLLHSIYTGQEAQCNTTNNHTQYIILTYFNCYNSLYVSSPGVVLEGLLHRVALSPCLWNGNKE